MLNLRGQKLVIATHNPGKVVEIAELLKPLDLQIISVGDLGFPEPEETGATFTDNAVLKARAAAQASGLPALADDSGLSVSALNGAPGIYSARWAGPSKDFNLAMRRVHDELGNSPDRSAAFVCVLALAMPQGGVQSFEGRIEGNLVWPARGDKGFGYDPIFVPNGHDITFAEMNPAQKHSMSHRARAFEKLLLAFEYAD